MQELHSKEMTKEVTQKSHDDQVDINNQKSKKDGLSALIENLFRKFKTFGFFIMLFPLILLYIFCIGVALTPGFLLFDLVSTHLIDNGMVFRAFAYGITTGFSFGFFIITLVFVVPLVNLPFIPFVRSYRGPWYSVESIPWYYHNALTYLVRYTILEFITPSPLNILFYKMMGMKIGKNTMINTSNISDPCLITLGDNVTIGGSVYMMAHYGMKGYLIIDKLVIEEKAMVGLCAKILGGVRIGKKATIAPNATLLPKTIVGDGEKYGI